MLIAEAVLLLALDDEKGTIESDAWIQIDSALGGAMLLDLAIQGRIGVSDDSGTATRADGKVIKPGRLLVRDENPTGVAELDQVLSKLPKLQGKQVYYGVAKAAEGIRDALLARLLAAGLVTQDKRKVMGLFPRTVWPAGHGGPENELRERMTAILDRGAEPDLFTGCVLSICHAAGILPSLMPTPDRDQRKARKARATELAPAEAAADWMQTAGGAALAETTAVVLTAVQYAATLNMVILIP